MRRLTNSQELVWFLELNSNNQLDLEPAYQRKSVWSTSERKYFLDTIFKNFPCPAIFLHKTIDDSGKTTHHVIDGKQRLETVILFTQDKISIGEDFGDVNLNGKKWSELSTDYKKKFWNYVFSVEYIDEIEESLLSEVFNRFNKNSKKLEPQELRHAKYTGWFLKQAEQEAEKQEWKDLGISTTGNARRMKDIQFISELLLVILDNKIVGFSQEYIDDKYAAYEVPDETNPEFDEQEFIDIKEKVKNIILSINTENNSVVKFGKTFTHFYTLWAFVYFNLDKINNIHQLAANYAGFMSIVEQFAKSEEPNVLMEKNKAMQTYKDAFDYFQYSRGANTDLKQRQNRLNVLTRNLLNE